MKFKFSIFILVVSFLAFGFSSCGDDAIDCNEAAISSAFQDEINRVTAAATTFGNDPSSSNCNSYLDAIDDYLDRLRDLQGCADEVGQGAEFRESLREIEDERDLLSC